MRTLATALLASVALLATAMPVTGAEPATAADATSPVKFGMDASAVAAQSAAGVAPDYGTFWIGPWTLSSGWGGPDGQLTTMKNAGVTPAIHFYYWGDDITPTCVENGCYSDLHNAQKDRAGWEKLGTQLTDHLNSKMGGAPVVIFLESEFNKGGIQTYEPFDGYMAAMADKIHAAYPNAIIVLGFGNWGSNSWGNFDRAAAASDMVGIQGMRGSTKQNIDGMNNLYEGLLAGVTTLETKFPDQPIMLTDIAVSSYPDSTHVTVQASVLKEVFDHMDDLKAHGVEALIYRSWKDSPSMDLANYYGEAERHWGLAWAGNGTQKAAGKVWVDGVTAERAAAVEPANAAPVAGFTASASSLTVAVDASASADPDGDALTYAWTFGDGAVGSGRTANHAYAAAGTYTLALTVSDGTLSATASKPVTVAKPVTTSTTPTTTAATTSTTASAFTAQVAPSSSSNEWWVQAGVAPAPAKVEVKAGSGSYVALTKESYGWAKSLNVAKGTMVQFRVTSAGGQTATTPAQAWLVDMSAKTATTGTSSTTTTTAATTTTTAASTTTTAASSTTTATGVTAKVTPSGNEYWVQAGVASTKTVTKVEAKVGSGSYVALNKESYGWAKSLHAAKGTSVQFRVTANDGSVATTAPQAWLVDMSAKTASFGPASTSTASATTTASKTTTTTAATSSTTAATSSTTATSTSSTFKASFTPKNPADNTRVEVGVTANQPIAKAEAKVNSGSWVTLDKTSAGTYAKSLSAPDGAKVTFRASNSAGTTYTSVGYTWG